MIEVAGSEHLRGRRVLVTGGAGFIGSNLVGALLGLGAAVKVLDNLSTGTLDNLVEYQGDGRLEVIVGDTRDRELCRSALEGVELVLHQAALGSVPRSFDDPAETLDANLVGLTVLFDEARRSGVERFVYASSSSVYGDSTREPKREGEEGRPLSPYALSKSAGDRLLEIVGKDPPPVIVGLRYFNVFGPKQNPAGAYAAAIPRFASLLLQGKQPTVFGDGRQTRDFTFVENVVAANLQAVLAEPQAHGQVCNIGCGETTAVLDLCRLIAATVERVTGRACPHEPLMGPARPGEPRSSLADITRAGRLLGYRPRVSIRDGLEPTVRWLADRQERP
jgi:UDP-N-acetylglucosamine 4-epimerase